MLCPEVWTFQPPAASHKFESGDYSDESDLCDSLINRHHFNSLVSVVLPNVKKVSGEVTSIFRDDGDYYMVENISLAEFVCKDFIEAFVKRGHFTLLSDRTYIDVDDCVCITPDGVLILNLLRETYVELGLEGTPSSFSSGIPSRYIVSVDLASPSFVPGKKNYQRVNDYMLERLHRFKVLLAWDPPNDEVCPSSVAAYLHNKGFSILLCKPRFKKRIASCVKVPVLCELSSADGNEDVQNLLEWLGAFLLQADINSGSRDNYVTTFQTPQPNVTCKDVLVLESRGFFSVQKINKIFSVLRQYVKVGHIDPWLGFHVQGYADSPVSWGNQEHSYFTDGDNHYTIFLHPDRYLSCQIWSSCRRPRKNSKNKKK